jgi:hypothetical protein
MSWLRTPGGPPARGGTLDLELNGKLIPDARDGFRIDLPLVVHLQGTTLSLAGAAPTPVEKLTLPIGLSGPLASPRISLDPKALADALTAAGKAELAKFVNENLGKLGQLPGEAGKAATELLQGKTPEQIAAEAKKKAEEEAKKQLEELKKKLPIPGLGGKKEEKKN